MKYFIDTEFLEGTQKTWWGSKTKPTIDLISIGIVAEDGREYYAISKEFNLEEAWNRYDWKEHKPTHKIDEGKKLNQKIYWIRENVLFPIFKELQDKAFKDWGYFPTPQHFTLKGLKKLISKYGKTNTQIAEEVTMFCVDQFIGIEFDLAKEKFTVGKELSKSAPEFYGYYADYDWVVFCWLFGKMTNLPTGFPMYCIDLKQTIDFFEKNIAKRKEIGAIEPSSIWYKVSKYKEHPDYPKQTNEHNALADAKWNKELYKFLNEL